MGQDYDRDLKLGTIRITSAKCLLVETFQPFGFCGAGCVTNAKCLLAETDLKVCQVHEQVGYGNIGYFS